jgi:hypothetical protein
MNIKITPKLTPGLHVLELSMVKVVTNKVRPQSSYLEIFGSSVNQETGVKTPFESMRLFFNANEPVEVSEEHPNAVPVQLEDGTPAFMNYLRKRDTEFRALYAYHKPSGRFPAYITASKCGRYRNIELLYSLEVPTVEGTTDEEIL